MSRRNAIDLFDPEVARKHAQAELRSKMGGGTPSFNPGAIDPSITASVQAKILEALAKRPPAFVKRPSALVKRPPALPRRS